MPLNVIGRANLPQEFVRWNNEWGAPNGRPVGRARTFRATARKAGPFAFQPNNLTRTFEFPWAFYAVPSWRGLRVVEVGGALSGLQFVLSKAGAEVVNVDPFVDYGSVTGYGTLDPLGTHQKLNRAFRTDVRLVRDDLMGADLPSGSTDAVLAISTLEHLDVDAATRTVNEVRRILKPGGRLIATIDLFLDLQPFSDEKGNRYGRNVDVADLVEASGLELIVGEEAELNGYPQFDVEAIRCNLDRYLVGNFPALAQCLVLENR